MAAASASSMHVLAATMRHSRLLALQGFLRRSYRELKNEHGVVTCEAWARMLIEASTVFLCGRDWTHAFEQVRLLGDRSHLTLDLRAVRMAPVQAAPFTAPSYLSARGLLPRNRRVPYSQLISEPLGRQVRILLR